MEETKTKLVLESIGQNGEATENSKEKKHFNYNELYSEMSIIKFGIWQVEKGALVGKIPYEFIISSSKIWKTSVYNGYLVWDWLIHFAENSNLSAEDIKDLNTAFFFCLDYFRDQKPNNLTYVSTFQTLLIQKQKLELRIKNGSNCKIKKKSRYDEKNTMYSYPFDNNNDVLTGK